MPRISLTKGECYCGILGLYSTIATKLGRNSDDIFYDCRKLCVTKPVMEEVFSYYKTECDATKTTFNQLWLNVGPKANLIGDSYEADVQEGFILEVKP